jgi:hypothetical protein
LHKIGNVAEAAGLGAVSENREIVTAQGLIEKRGNHTPVVQRHTRPVRIENPRNRRVDAVGPLVGHCQSFGVPLAFVVAGPEANGINIAPVGFRLRMFEWIAVAFRGGREKKLCTMFSGELKHVPRPDGTDIERFDGMVHVVHGAC